MNDQSTKAEGHQSSDAEQAPLNRRAGTVAGMTLLSRTSGLVRDIAFAYLFGASAAADLFFVAFRIPNFFRRLFAEGAFNQAFVPVLMEYKAKGQSELRLFLGQLSGVFALTLTLVVIAGLAFAGPLAALFAPGFIDQPTLFSQLTELVHITFPYLGLISLTAYAGALLNAHGRFALPAFTPVMLNVCLTLAALLGLMGHLQSPPIVILAWGVLVAGVLQCLIQLPSLARLHLLPKPVVATSHPGMKQVGHLLVPAIFSASVGQINALVNTMIASTLATGSIAWLYYADRLLELPVGLIAVALGTVMLPHLSRLVTEEDERGFLQTVNWGFGLGLMLGLPAAIALYLLAEPLLAFLYMSFAGSAMTAFDVEMAGQALQMFAIALPGFVLVKVLAPAFFAHQDTKTPFRFALAAVVVNLIGSLATFQSLGHVGLALATALSAWTHAGLLYVGLQRRGWIRFDATVVFVLLRTLLACVGLGAGLVLGMVWLNGSELTLQQWLALPGFDRSLRIILVCMVGLAGYALILLLLGVRPRHFLRAPQ
ncbi:murein biosynthesis integral membrane protein MurJ [Gammaproteobacteria bacterium]|nr:murein biosynthesis integral membrane protein MurJ [Gammaproteobacteria bacterium]